MKKMIQFVSGALVLLVLISCGGPELLSIIPAYKGEAVTSTHHTFTNDDFYVIASYADGTDEVVSDFEFEVEGMEKGYYVINITYKDMENPVFVPINVQIYPSDFE